MSLNTIRQMIGVGTPPEQAKVLDEIAAGAVAAKAQIAALVALTDSSGGTANNTIAAIPNPADTPASADALRDDLVANTIPALKDAIADLAAKVNAIISALKA